LRVQRLAPKAIKPNSSPKLTNSEVQGETMEPDGRDKGHQREDF
jgi:hypothetical protein